MKTRRRVLLVINTLGRAGAETALMQLLKRLRDDQWDVSLFVLLGQGEMVKELPEHVKLLNRTYDDTPVLTDEGKQHLKRHLMQLLLNRGNVLRQAIPVAVNAVQMLRGGRGLMLDKLLWRAASDGAQRIDEHFDLAIAYLEGGSAYYVADHVKADRKVGFIHIDYSHAGYTRRMDHDCYVGFDRIFPVSDEVRTAFLKVYPECADRTEVFHNLVDQSSIRERAKEPGGFDDGYDGTRILTVGRLTEQKAYEISISAMRLLRDHGRRVRWYVLGEGDQRQKLEAQIRQLRLEQDFVLMGAKPNPFPYYAQTDLYVHASRFEGKSIAIQEAMTLGKPVIVSDCSGNREQVVPDVNGLMCDLTPESVCRAVEELLDDPVRARRLGCAAAQVDLTDEDSMWKINKLFD